MTVLTYKQIISELKSGKIRNSYYLYGQDINAVEKLAGAIRKKIVREGDEAYNLYQFDGQKLNLEELSDATETYPCFADYKCVMINDFSMDFLDTAHTKIFMKILEEIPPTTVIVFYITGFDIKAGKKTLGAKNKKLAEFIGGSGAVCEMNFMTQTELAEVIVKKAAVNGCSISYGNAQELAQRCLCNTLIVSNELDKLCAYVGNGGEITSETIKMLVSRQLDADAFSLARAVASFNGETALNILDDIMSIGTEPVILVSAMAMAFGDLYKSKLGFERGLSERTVAEDFGYKGREFVIRNAMRDSKRLSLSHLRYCINVLMETDRLLKSSRTESRLLIEKAVAQMILYKQ